jgi:hypothetical protein
MKAAPPDSFFPSFFFFFSLPQFFNGESVEEYNGGRGVDALSQFVTSKLAADGGAPAAAEVGATVGRGGEEEEEKNEGRTTRVKKMVNESTDAKRERKTEKGGEAREKCSSKMASERKNRLMPSERETGEKGGEAGKTCSSKKASERKDRLLPSERETGGKGIDQDEGGGQRRVDMEESGQT